MDDVLHNLVAVRFTAGAAAKSANAVRVLFVKLSSFPKQQRHLFAKWSYELDYMNAEWRMSPSEYTLGLPLRLGVQQINWLLHLFNLANIAAAAINVTTALAAFSR